MTLLVSFCGFFNSWNAPKRQRIFTLLLAEVLLQFHNQSNYPMCFSSINCCTFLTAPPRRLKNLTLKQIKALPQHKVTVTLQCAGNRRKEMSKVKEVKGLSWNCGSISTAEFTGILSCFGGTVSMWLTSATIMKCQLCWFFLPVFQNWSL